MRSQFKKSKNKAGGQTKLAQWRRHHRYAIQNVLNSLSHGRWTVLINSTILGLSLALPLALISFTNHSEIFAETLGDTSGLTLYLRLTETVDGAGIDNLLSRLKKDPRIKQLSYHSPEDVLVQVLKQLSIESSKELEILNPFFHTVRVTLGTKIDTNPALDDLVGELTADNRIAHIELVGQSSNAGQTGFVGIFQRFSHALSVIVLLSSLLICSYMVRNQIARQQLELEVTRYCGADDAFLRRPFLYWGAAQGCLGAIFAGVIVYACFFFLIMPTSSPGAGTQSFGLMPLFYRYEFGATLFIGTALGLIGAWVATKLHFIALAGIGKNH